MQSKSKYLRANEAASFLRLSPKTLSKWRWAKRPPKYAKIGRTVLYSREDLETFVNAGRREKVNNDRV